MSDTDSIATTETFDDEDSYMESIGEYNGRDDTPRAQRQERRPSSTTLSTHQLRKNRGKMVILHYIATYSRWSISLFLFLATRTLPLGPASKSIRQPIRDFRIATTAEANRYFESVVHTFSFLDLQLNETVADENRRVVQVEDANQLRLDKALQISLGAHNKTVTARRALQIWQSETSIPLQDHNETLCTTQDRVVLTQMLGQDYSVVQDTVTEAVDDYLVDSRSVLQHVTAYAKERSAYDYNYFVGAKIQATLDVLNVLESPDLQLSVDQTELIERLKEILETILSTLHRAYVRIAALTDRLEQFYLSIGEFFENYLDIYGRLRKASIFVADFLPGKLLFPDFLDMSDIPTARMLLPIQYELVQFNGPLPDIDILLDDYIREALRLLAELVAELAEEASEKTVEALKSLIEKIREHLTLEDYDPPKYVSASSGEGDIALQKENKQLYERGEEIRNIVLQAIDTDTILQRQANRTENIVPDQAYEATSFNGSATAFDYIKPKFITITIPDFLESIGEFVLANMWLIEMVIQLVRMWRLRRKYEKNGIPDLPEVTFGAADDETDETEKPGTLLLIQRAFFKHISTPWMAFGFILLPTLILAVAFWFPIIKGQCIDTRNGTFISRHVIAPLAINSANVKGYAYHAQAELDCRRRQQQLCSQMYGESDRRFRQAISELASAQKRFEDAGDVKDLLDRCIRLDSMDESMEINCCGLEGYQLRDCSPDQIKSMCPIDPTTFPPSSFRPPGETLSSHEFFVELLEWDLEDSRFDCGALEDTCSRFPTHGVDEDWIAKLSVELGCEIETYAIMCCIFALVALFHAIMWNISFYLAFNGLKRLVWRKLDPEGIELRARMTEDGELVIGSTAGERAERASRVLRQYEWIGRCQIALGSLIFVLWFGSFFLIRNQLAKLRG